MSIKNTDFKEELDILFKAILKLENEDECYKFFEDIATINELKSLAQRMQVAKMLKEKKVYTEISIFTTIIIVAIIVYILCNFFTRI